jgi:two-component system chemotaxis response regulator CheY
MRLFSSARAYSGNGKRLFHPFAAPSDESGYLSNAGLCRIKIQYSVIGERLKTGLTRFVVGRIGRGRAARSFPVRRSEPCERRIRMKTLVVDDFSTMRKIVKNVLRQIDITNVTEAENGKQALEILKKEGDFELIVSDWIMPEMTGIEFLRACKDDESVKKIPFVMVTAEAQKDSVIEAIKGGVDNYIVKPFTPDKLQDAIQKAVARTRSQQ